MQNFDFSPFYRSTVGFDRLFTALGSIGLPEGKSSYPPYNIERTGEDTYRISVAVAGFFTSDIASEAKGNNLVIKGGKSAKSDEDLEFLHQGIAQRAFDLRFQLADYVEVTGADLENGLLHVSLKRELPESKKPRKIKIASSGDNAAIEDKGTVN